MFARHFYGMSVKPDPWNKQVQVLIRLDKDTNEQWVGIQDDRGDIGFQAIDAGSYVREPTIDISEQDAQGVFDALYNAGYRPNGGRDSEGVHEAQRQHIADLRKVVESLTRGPQIWSVPAKLTPHEEAVFKSSLDNMGPIQGLQP